MINYKPDLHKSLVRKEINTEDLMLPLQNVKETPEKSNTQRNEIEKQTKIEQFERRDFFVQTPKSKEIKRDVLIVNSTDHLSINQTFREVHRIDLVDLRINTSNVPNVFQDETNFTISIEFAPGLKTVEQFHVNTGLYTNESFLQTLVQNINNGSNHIMATLNDKTIFLTSQFSFEVQKSKMLKTDQNKIELAYDLSKIFQHLDVVVNSHCISKVLLNRDSELNFNSNDEIFHLSPESFSHISVNFFLDSKYHVTFENFILKLVIFHVLNSSD